MENAKCVLIDNNPERMTETRSKVESAGHVVVREVQTFDDYQDTMHQFYHGKLAVDFFLCERDFVSPGVAAKMRRIGAIVVRFGKKKNIYARDMLSEERTIEEVLNDIAEVAQIPRYDRFRKKNKKIIE